MVPKSRIRRFAVAVFLAMSVSAFLAASCSKGPMGPTPPTLRVISVVPATGSTTGGTLVLIGGTEFSADATVTVGGVAATNVVVQSPTTIQATVGIHPAAGAGDVAVTSGGRTASLVAGFTFVAPSGANQPPVVTNIRSIGTRSNQPSGFADLDEIVTLVASVSDAETSSNQLEYEWSGPGAFAGPGAAVGWHLPATATSTPTPITATLTVIEPFVEGSITHRNVTTAPFVIQAHDSQKEVLDMGEDFLTLFSRSEVGTNEVLHNFSTTCDRGTGRSDEAVDVEKNRADFVQDFSKFRITQLPPVTFNFGGRCTFRLRLADACAAYRVHWEVIYRKADAFHKVGDRGTADGIDHVTAVLQNNRWLLCHSDFEGIEVNTTTGLSRLVQW